MEFEFAFSEGSPVPMDPSLGRGGCTPWGARGGWAPQGPDAAKVGPAPAERCPSVWCQEEHLPLREEKAQVQKTPRVWVVFHLFCSEGWVKGSL